VRTAQAFLIPWVGVAVKKTIKPCEPFDVPVIFEVINASARAYKGVIPPDRWHEPYMRLAELQSEIAKGVRFYGYNSDGRMLGVMGIQEVKDVMLIRHAYVRTQCRGQGIGRALLEHLSRLTKRPILIGTWKAAEWAIRFYKKNGFALVGDEEKNRLLRAYWTIPDRQIEESVVLVSPEWRKRQGQFDHGGKTANALFPVAAARQRLVRAPRLKYLRLSDEPSYSSLLCGA